MFEKDDYLQAKKRSPQKRDLDRVFGCSRRMDEIWIPSEFQRAIFSRQVPAERIHVIPEAVDTSLFTPLLSRRIRDKKGPFEFLSLFSWSYRKGWDILLESYFRAFTIHDNVILSKF
jgi:glycosyltransferase involved in cell wall biosynthesis